MIKSDYDDFFDTVIKRCIDEIMSQAEQYGCKYKGNKCKFSIYKNYQRKRDFIKNKYMKKEEQMSLDRHKVASCMIYSILKVKPIKIDKYMSNLPEKVLLANEYLAFFVALNIIEMYRKDELNEGTGYEIILPTTYHESEENKNGTDSAFMSNTCKALYYVELHGMQRFDIFAYSSILFLLEKYTDTIKKISDMQS